MKRTAAHLRIHDHGFLDSLRRFWYRHNCISRISFLWSVHSWQIPSFPWGISSGRQLTDRCYPVPSTSSHHPAQNKYNRHPAYPMKHKNPPCPSAAVHQYWSEKCSMYSSPLAVLARGLLIFEQITNCLQL